MQGPRRGSPPLAFARIALAARQCWAHARARYALMLAGVGALLLLGSDVSGAQRQRSVESLARARIVPFDEQCPGYYVIDLSSAPLAMSESVFATGLSIPWWLVGALLVAGLGIVAWQSIARARWRRSEVLQRYRRPRSSRPPARIIAKRQAVAAALEAAARTGTAGALTVRHVMTEAMVIAPPSTTLHSLANMLMSAPLRHVLICEHSGRLLGVVTDRDLHHRRGKRAVDLMTRGPVCVPSGALLGPATALMVDHQISCLPVVDDGRVRGVLTADDIALALECVLKAAETRTRQPDNGRRDGRAGRRARAVRHGPIGRLAETWRRTDHGRNADARNARPVVSTGPHENSRPGVRRKRCHDESSRRGGLY